MARPPADTFGARAGSRSLLRRPGSKAPEGVGAGEPGDGMPDLARGLWARYAERRGVIPIGNTLRAARRISLFGGGRWLVYMSDESGSYQIYVRSFPDVSGGRWRVSSSAAREPRWSSAGDAIFYRTEGEEASLVSVPVDTDPEFRAGAPRRLFPDTFRIGTWPHVGYWDVDPQGRRDEQCRKGDFSLASRETQVHQTQCEQ